MWQLCVYVGYVGSDIDNKMHVSIIVMFLLIYLRPFGQLFYCLISFLKSATTWDFSCGLWKRMLFNLDHLVHVNLADSASGKQRRREEIESKNKTRKIIKKKYKTEC